MSGIVHRQDIIERQIVGMGVAYFDIASRKQSGAIIEHGGLVLSQLWGLVDLLREQNGKLGHEILIRPHGEHGMTLVSGIAYQRLQSLKLEGYEPAIVVEYGTDLYQAWFKHDRKLDRQTSERAAQQLAHIAGVDAAGVHWDSYGYLANFQVPAWSHGAAMEAQLIEDSGTVYRRAKALLDSL